MRKVSTVKTDIATLHLAAAAALGEYEENYDDLPAEFRWTTSSPGSGGRRPRAQPAGHLRELLGVRLADIPSPAGGR